MRIRIIFSESPRFIEYCYVFGFLGPRRFLPLLRVKFAVLQSGRAGHPEAQGPTAWRVTELEAYVHAYAP